MVTFFHLPREDVVFPHILLRLDTVETWKLKRVCRALWALCEEYFSTFCSSITYSERGLTTEDDATLCTCLQDRACVVRALGACTKLKRIDLRLHGHGASTERLRKTCSLLMESVWHVHATCQLVSLRLASVDCQSSLVGWERLGEKCGALRHLHITDVSHFDDKCLENLTSLCTSLVTLTLETLPGIQGVYLKTLAEASPNLEKLSFSGCYNMDTEHLQRVLRVCYNVRSLDLSSLFATVDDTTILTVKEFCVQLEWLCVHQCSRVTERYLLPLQQSGVQVIGATVTDGGRSKYHKILGQI